MAGRDEDEVTRDVVNAHARSSARRVPARYREPLLLHPRENIPLQMTQMRQLVDEQDALVGAVDRTRDHPIIRLRPKLRMAAVRVVPHVPKQLHIACPRSQDERVPPNRNDDLPGALLLKLAPLLESLLVQDLDHLARTLEDHHPLLPEPLPGSGHALPASELAHSHFDEPPQKVPERVVRRGSHLSDLGPGALGTEAVFGRRVRATIGA